MKTAERVRARRLRAIEGRSVKEIAQLVGVSQSTVSLWVRDIMLSEQQRHALGSRAQALRNEARSAWFRARRQSYQHDGRALAGHGDPVHAAGCMLYWAEGSRSRRAVQFVNSDPQMARFFVAFLKAYYELPDNVLRVDCNLFADHIERQQEIERFWLDTLGLPASCLRNRQ